MANVLEQLKGYTTVVADTGNFEGIYTSEFKDFLFFFFFYIINFYLPRLE